MTSGPSTIVRPACRYLGTTHDAAVHCGYATRENVCYASGRRQSINLEFQETHCLGGPHEECVRFQEAQGIITTTAAQPAVAVAPIAEPPPDRGVAWRPILLGAVGVITVAALAFFLLRPGPAPASPSTSTASPITATAAPPIAVAPTAEPAATDARVPTATATQPPAPTATATQTVTAAATATTTTAPTATTVVNPTATIAPTTVISGPFLLTADVVNVREGPGVGYIVLGVLPAGQQWPVQGRNDAGDWVQGCCLAGVPGWITTQFVTVSVPISDLPVITVLPPITTTTSITLTATVIP